MRVLSWCEYRTRCAEVRSHAPPAPWGGRRGAVLVSSDVRSSRSDNSVTRRWSRSSVAADLGDWHRAAVLVGDGHALMDQIGASWDPFDARRRQESLGQARAALCLMPLSQRLSGR